MTSGTNNEILKKLEAEGKKKGLSPRFLEFYQRLLLIQSKAKQRIGIVKPKLSGKTINQRVERGLPLVTFGKLALDWSLVTSIFAEVTAAFADYPDLFGEVPRSLTGPEGGSLLNEEAVKAWFEGARLPSTIAVDGAGKYSLIEAIIHATLQPFLTSYSKALLSFVDQERWRRGYCPICGGKPDFAFLDKEIGARWLLCSRCDTEWLFQRLQCPYCGTQDQNALAYFTDDEGLYRLYVCEQCKQYLKAIDLRQAKTEVLPPLERLLTLDIDVQAQREGYRSSGQR